MSSNTRENLYILMPAYNEADNIESIIRDWYPLLADKGEQSKLVINCSGSTDETVEIIESLEKQFPAIDILTKSENTYGAKVIDLYDYAVQNDADFIFQTDSDGQTNPKEFDEFWKQRDECDAIIGKRTNRGDGKLRSFVMKVECTIINAFFGVRVPDANVPFRLVNHKILEKYMNLIPRDYSMPNIMLTALMAYNREKICFREISFANRTAGHQSMDYKKIFQIGIESLSSFSKAKKK